VHRPNVNNNKDLCLERTKHVSLARHAPTKVTIFWHVTSCGLGNFWETLPSFPCTLMIERAR